MFVRKTDNIGNKQPGQVRGDPDTGRLSEETAQLTLRTKTEKGSKLRKPKFRKKKKIPAPKMEAMEVDATENDSTIKIEVDSGSTDAELASSETDGFEVSEKQFRHVVKNVNKLVYGSTSPSTPQHIRGLPWKILVMPRPNREGQTVSLGFFLQCNSDSDSITWSCSATAHLRVIPHDPDNEGVDNEKCSKRISHIFHSKENDWGFSHFLPWEDAIDPSKGYCSPDYNLTFEAKVYADAPHGIAWDSKKHTGYVGLKNQGATCYMNSLLQTLFFTNTLRSAVYQMPTDFDDQSVPLALQRVFYELQSCDKPVGTKKLTKSFGWESLDSFMQHDVQEFCRVLLDNLESKMKGTSVEGTINNLFEAKTISYIRCKNVDYQSRREEIYYDISLPVRNNETIIDSFKEYVKPDLLEGDNKFDAGKFGLQDAEKGVTFKDFPPVLHIQLMRFQYDPITDSNVKINDKFEFGEEINLDDFLESPNPDDPADYVLHAVLVHSGDNYGGHYVAYITPTGDGNWFKFDDDVVACCNTKEAIYSNFGGSDENNGFVKSCTNAYMLVYIRKNELSNILFETTEQTDIPSHLSSRFNEEREIEAIKRKEKNEAHYFLTINIISDEQFNGHQGSGLLDPDCVSFRTIKARKDLTWAKLRVKLSEYLGAGGETFRIWFFKRKYIRSSMTDHEVWRPEFIDDDDNEKYLSAFHSPEAQTITIWLEMTPIDSLSIQPFNTKRDLLVFIRLYEPDTGSLCYCGHIIVPMSTKLKELLPELTRRAHWIDEPSAENILMFEDRHLGNCRHLKDLDDSLDQSLLFFKTTPPPSDYRDGGLDIEDGVVIIFQKHPKLYPGERPASGLRNVAEYFRDQANRHEVVFHNIDNQSDPGFVVSLNQRENYQYMAAEVGKILERDPKRIQFFKVPPYTREGVGQAVKSTEKRTIEEIIYLPNNKRYMMYMQVERESRKNRKKMFYQLIDMDIVEFESKKQLPIKFLFADMKEEELVLYLNPNSTMKDLISEARNRVTGLDPVSKLRVLEYTNTRIINILPENEEVDFNSYAAHGGANQRHIRIDEVPEPQLTFSQGEILIQVGHFHNSVQNYFGTPFFVKIINGDTIKSVREKIKDVLEIPEKDFAKWKIALVQSSRPRYYSVEEEGTVIDTKHLQVDNCDGVPLVQNRIWIGLDHPMKQKPKAKQPPLPPITIRN